MGSKTRHTKGEPKFIELEKLREFTNNFANELGAGTYGTVFKGIDDVGNEIAVKVLKEIPDSSRGKDYKREFESLLKLSHPNIIQLVGYCYQPDENYNDVLKMSEPIIRTALCFEYAAKGNLGKHMSDRGDKLDWLTCYKIIKGTCEGLRYLHNHPSGSFWHLDLKPENILLHHNMVPKIADFGMAKLITEQTSKSTVNPFRTWKYTPNEYKIKRTISKEFDIYSLGVIILEIVAGTKTFEDTDCFSEQDADLAFDKWRPRISPMYYEQVKTCLRIALKCMVNDRHKRPKIQNIIDDLNMVENMTPTVPVSLGQNSNLGSAEMGYGSKPDHLTLQHLKDITKNFSNERILGRGGFGVVYKGVLPSGEVVAVKKLLQARRISQKQYENEVNLMKLHHPNIVRLVGYCYETQRLLTPREGKFVIAWNTESLLCLEYLPNGSLHNYISDASSGFDWRTRWKIIEGICFGLTYLHEQSNGPIFHMDLKPTNILLDENMVPKIADFGLSRLLYKKHTISTATTSGTIGYMPPEYLQGIITPKSDIFSLGVIIMEVITGHSGYPLDITTSSVDFIELELQNWRNRLQGGPDYTSLEMCCQQIKRCIQIGLICVNPEWTRRPTMKQIINMLQGLESMNFYITNEQLYGSSSHTRRSGDKVILYVTTMSGIAKTFNECNTIRAALEAHKVDFTEKDLFDRPNNLSELKRLLAGSSYKLPVPVLSINGNPVGDARKLMKLHSEDGLQTLFE